MTATDGNVIIAVIGACALLLSVLVPIAWAARRQIADVQKRADDVYGVVNHGRLDRIEASLEAVQRDLNRHHAAWDALPPDLRDADRLAGRLGRMNEQIDELRAVLVHHLDWEEEKYRNLRRVHDDDPGHG